METTEFLLTNLNCEACIKVSQIKIGKIPGVSQVEINGKDKEATGAITADRKVTIEEIQQSLAGTDYKVSAL